MRVEILSTGDEVLLGDIVDTNSAWLCRKLTALGVRPEALSAVGDDIDQIGRQVCAIARRADLCIVTGGLGPTSDDVTAAGCALAAGADLELHPKALASMAEFFSAKGWQLTPENEKQAMSPKGAAMLENLNGTAPGFELKIEGCTFYCLPGVPSEMKAMFKGSVLPTLEKKTGARCALLIRRLTVFGLPESEVGRRLSEFSNAYPGIRLGFRAVFPLIEVKLVKAVKKDGPFVSGAQNDAMQDGELSAAVIWTADRLDHRVVSFEGLPLEQEVGRLLRRAGQTLSAAESCTGGLISHMITDVPGASDYFLFSGVTYANAAKVGVLGVSQETLMAHGAVHEKTAEQMATGARRAGGSDWAVATTGIAGPSGGTTDKPVGTVCVGVAGPDGVQARRFVLDTGDREKNKHLFAAAALEMLRRALSQEILSEG